VDSTIPYEVMQHLQQIDARLDALEAPPGTTSTSTEEEEAESTETTEEEARPTRSARGRS
jgi:hypothetical protein